MAERATLSSVLYLCYARAHAAWKDGTAAADGRFMNLMRSSSRARARPYSQVRCPLTLQSKFYLYVLCEPGAHGLRWRGLTWESCKLLYGILLRRVLARLTSTATLCRGYLINEVSHQFVLLSDWLVTRCAVSAPKAGSKDPLGTTAASHACQLPTRVT